MSQEKSIEKAVATLKNVLITEKTGTAWWF